MKRRTRKRLMLCGAAIAGLAVPVCTALALLLLNLAKPAPSGGGGPPDGQVMPPARPIPGPGSRPAMPVLPAIISVPSDRPGDLAALGMPELPRPAGEMAPPDGFSPAIPPGMPSGPSARQRRALAPAIPPVGAPDMLIAGDAPPAVSRLGTPGTEGGSHAPAAPGNPPPAGGGWPGHAPAGQTPSGITPPIRPMSMPTADAAPPAPQKPTAPASNAPGPSATPPSGEPAAAPPAHGPNVDPAPLGPLFQELPLATIGLPVETVETPNTVPEPGMLALLAAALAGLGLSRRRP